jgi:hypothetical protein
VEVDRVGGEARACPERQLNAAKATAAMQEALTQSEISIRVAENAGAADLARAAKDAERVRITAEAAARNIFAFGEATVQAAKLQVDAYGDPEYRLTEEVASKLSQAIETGHQAVVPQILVGGNSNEHGGVARRAAVGSAVLDTAQTEPRHP